MTIKNKNLHNKITMKTFTIFILILLSCNQTKNVYGNNYNVLQGTKQVQGSWQKCKSKSKEGIVSSNICQTINLEEDGNGKLLLGDKLICSFKWKTEKNLIKFSFDSSNDQSNFLYGVLEYTFKLYDKGDLEYLEIKPQNKEIVYFLSRVKNIKK